MMESKADKVKLALKDTKEVRMFLVDYLTDGIVGPPGTKASAIMGLMLCERSLLLLNSLMAVVACSSEDEDGRQGAASADKMNTDNSQ